MQRTIARQAEAERERRAKVIHAEGELAASQCLADAADVFGRNPVVLQLRYLQRSSESRRRNIPPRFSPFPSIRSPLSKMADPEIVVAIKPIVLYSHLHTCSKVASPPLRPPH